MHPNPLEPVKAGRVPLQPRQGWGVVPMALAFPQSHSQLSLRTTPESVRDRELADGSSC